TEAAGSALHPPPSALPPDSALNGWLGCLTGHCAGNPPEGIALPQALDSRALPADMGWAGPRYGKRSALRAAGRSRLLERLASAGHHVNRFRSRPPALRVGSRLDAVRRVPWAQSAGDQLPRLSGWHELALVELWPTRDNLALAPHRRTWRHRCLQHRADGGRDPVGMERLPGVAAFRPTSHRGIPGRPRVWLLTVRPRACAQPTASGPGGLASSDFPDPSRDPCEAAAAGHPPRRAVGRGGKRPAAG